MGKYNHFVGINTNKIIEDGDGAVSFEYNKKDKNGKTAKYGIITIKDNKACLQYTRNTYDDGKDVSELFINTKKTDDADEINKFLKVETALIFESIMRKMYILYALHMGQGIDVNSIAFGKYIEKKELAENNKEYIDDNGYCIIEFTEENDGKYGFPFIVSTISTRKFTITNKNFKTISESFVSKSTNEDWNDKAIIALSAYLQSKNRKHEVYRLSNLWTAMNAFYGELVERYNLKARNRYKEVFDTSLKWFQTFEIDGRQVNKWDYILLEEKNDSKGMRLLKKIYGDDMKLRKSNGVRQRDQFGNDGQDGFDFLVKSANNDLMVDYKKPKDFLSKAAQYEYDDVEGRYKTHFEVLYKAVYKYSLRDRVDESFEDDFPGLFEWSSHFNENIYFVVLINLSYYLRCEFLHGNFNNLTTYKSKGHLNNSIALANYFMDKFLTDNLPELLRTDEMDDETFIKCRDWVIKEKENETIYKKPEGFLNYVKELVMAHDIAIAEACQEQEQVAEDDSEIPFSLEDD